MARIRTIKPEFWTDERVVSLPFEARLLFIGIWNFCDDSGAIDDSPERIRMQIFPGNHEVDIYHLLDLLVSAGLMDRWAGDEAECLVVRNWSKHQKIDNPSRKTMSREGYRKRAIPSEARVAVAKKYGCSPGGEVDAECFYCGYVGVVKWWTLTEGKVSKYVTLSGLEFDHFISEQVGGPNCESNIVLACRPCNRAKREFDAIHFFEEKHSIPPRKSSVRAIEPSPLDQGSRTKDQGEDRECAAAREPRSVVPPKPEDVTDQTWSDWLAHRRRKRAIVNETVLAEFRREAAAADVKLEEALKVSVAQGWQGFRADWVKGTAGKATNANGRPVIAASRIHMQNMPLGSPTCECAECVSFRSRKAQ